MRVLGIESTCDETAVAIVERQDHAGSGVGAGHILINLVRSQEDEHARFGGVVPEIAARAHVDVLDGMIRRAFAATNLKLSDMDAIAVAAGPGLIGGVMVGLTTAKALALVSNKPLIALNHLEAHALTPRLTDGIAFPYLLLLVSGGHTQLVAVEAVGKYHRLGTTLDDAIGEAFDKVAKMLGLGYPGGPEVERMAEQGNPERFDLPRPLLRRPQPDFSLSGLKTAVRLVIQQSVDFSEQDRADLCASFQAAVVDCIIDRTRIALRSFRGLDRSAPTAIVVAGGVGANKPIRKALYRFATEVGLPLIVPPPQLCTDNGAMIAWAGIERLSLGLVDDFEVAARPRWPLDPLRAKLGAKA